MQEFIAVDEFLVGFVTLKIRRFKTSICLFSQKDHYEQPNQNPGTGPC